MRNSREIFPQRWLLGRSHRAIGTSVGVSVGAVSLALQRAASAELTWDVVQSLDEAELERRLYPAEAAAATRPEPDCAWIHRERHRPAVTLELFHHEYLQRHPAGLRYTSFCDRYREWLGRRGLVMRQVHVAGEKGFVDYSGKKPHIVDAATGEVIEVELFVGVLGPLRRPAQDRPLRQLDRLDPRRKGVDPPRNGLATTRAVFEPAGRVEGCARAAVASRRAALDPMGPVDDLPRAAVA